MNSRKTVRMLAVAWRGTPMDRLERIALRVREKMSGVDCSVFDLTRAYYAEALGEHVSCEEALARAQNKKAHKDAWFTRQRESAEDVIAFYQEDDFYLFRHPFNRRFGGLRWYMSLVKDVREPRVLEYGCGCASLTEWLERRFPNAKYTVADIPSKTLDFVRWKRNRLDLGYQVLEIGPGREGIPLVGEFDLIICEDVLEHTPNPVEIAAALVDHLAPGGILLTNFIDESGGENLEVAVQQREQVKELLLAHLEPIKAIDRPRGNHGLYVKTHTRRLS